MAEAEPQQLPIRCCTECTRRLPHIKRRRCDLRLTLAAQPATMLHTELGLQSATALGRDAPHMLHQPWPPGPMRGSTLHRADPALENA